jgi:hypothetical protein
MVLMIFIRKDDFIKPETNEWSYTSTTTIRLPGVVRNHRDNFTFYPISVWLLNQRYLV